MSFDNYLIQSLMWRQCVSEDIFKEIVFKCLKADSRQSEDVVNEELTSELLANYVSKVNRKLRDYQMAVSRGPNESDGTVYYGLINTADNHITQMSTQWSVKELLYYRKLIEAIILSENALISSTKALNIGRDEELKFTMTATEGLINRFVDQKWFEEITDGSIAIGVRTLLEMNVYIREHFEVRDCFRCKTLCIRGSDCMTCETKLHFHCIDSQFIPNNKCPNCGKQFQPNPHVIQSTASSRNTVTDNSNSGGEDQEEEEEQPVKRVQKARRSKRFD